MRIPIPGHGPQSPHTHARPSGPAEELDVGAQVASQQEQADAAADVATTTPRFLETTTAPGTHPSMESDAEPGTLP